MSKSKESWIVWDALKSLLNSFPSSPDLQRGMPRNVEIKAAIDDLEVAAAVAGELSESLGQILHQTDTFFCCPAARLKLRVIDNNPDGELIHYSRPDVKGPKTSNFTRTNVTNAKELTEVLGTAYGILGVVRKTRRLFMVGQTRIHIDDVEGLGSFLELEVMLGEKESAESGEKVTRDLMGKLGVSESQLLDVAYMDLILQASDHSLESSASMPLIPCHSN